MLVVDAQVHIWSAGTPLPHHRQEPFSGTDALAGMDEAGVDRAVLCPVRWDRGSRQLGIDAARAFPDRFATFGWFPPNLPEQRHVIDTWTSQPGMLGARFYFSRPQDVSWPTDGTLEWLWPAAERANVPLALSAAHFLPAVASAASRYPGLKLIVDHLGSARASKGDEAFVNIPELVTLAKYPNVAVKATGLPGNATDAYPFRSTHEPLHKVYDAFGPRRLFWGTDITRMPCSWRQCVTMFTEELPWLSNEDKELIMGRAFCEWVGWPV